MTTPDAKNDSPRAERTAYALLLALLAAAALREPLLGRGLILHDHLIGRTLSILGPANDVLGGGDWPLWLPSILCGAPLLANLLLGVLYPANWIAFALLEPAVAINAAMGANVLIATLGAYWALGRLGLGAPGAALGAVLYALSPYALDPSSFYHHLGTQAWFPVACGALLEMHRAARWSGAWRWSLAAGGAAALSFLAGGFNLVVPMALGAAVFFCSRPSAASARRAP